MSVNVTLRQVIVGLCQACIDGIGQECHTPGCILWLHKVDIPIGEELLVPAPAPTYWMTEKPSKPGWYWWRSLPKFDKDVVHVQEYESELYVYWGSDCEESVEEMGGEWAGPLPLPEERTT